RIDSTTYRLGLGLSTVAIIGNNPGSDSFLIDESDTTRYGGAFSGPKPGIEARLSINLDKKGDIMLPIGLTYQFYAANRTYPQGRNASQKIHHELNTLNLYTGLHYVILRLPLAESKIYAGMEVWNTYVHNIGYSIATNYLDPEFRDEIEHFDTKDESWRLGGLIRLGVQGRLANGWTINTGFGISYMNLFGRDNQRGELLTPFDYFEVQESAVYKFHYSLLIQKDL
ncbi:MAG: hypothetical protein ACLFR2_11735, partial [Candidatus Kapaibacterium sp.]